MLETFEYSEGLHDGSHRNTIRLKPPELRNISRAQFSNGGAAFTPHIAVMSQPDDSK